MYALFDDAGKFLAGRVMSEADSSMQIELDSGKRVKVKNANVLLRFDKPQPADLIAAAQAKAGEIDLDLAWEFAPEGEFGFADLARDYFSASAGPELQAAALFRLFDAPHYFRRAGKGQFKKAPEETIKAALLAIERKKQLAAQIEAWAAELVAGQCPAPVREQLYKILFKPDKNAPEYKAVVDAAKQSQRARWTCSRTPAPSPAPTSSTGGASCSSSSPRAPASAAGGPGDCGRAAAGPGAGLLDRRFADHRDRRRAVGHRPGLGRGGVRRAHRRARPGRAAGFAGGQGGPRAPVHRLHAGLEADHAARRGGAGLHAGRGPRLPGRQPVRDAGRGHAGGQEERDPAGAGAHRRQPAPRPARRGHHRGHADRRGGGRLPFAAELAFCFRLARQLKAAREVVRGKPENFNRPDYNFRLDGNTGEPDGSETVRISERRRGARWT
jgi:exoribonuclease-2